MQDALSAPSAPLPRDAPKPELAWLALKVGVLLGEYWQDQKSDPEYQAQLATWCDCLKDLPKDAIDWAITDRLKSRNRRKPMIGEIREAALSRLEPLPVLPSPESDPVPFGDNFVPLSAERARQIAQELEMQDSPFATGAVRALQMREANE